MRRREPRPTAKTTPPGHRRLQRRPVILADVAARCGVSAWTVSAALRADPRVKSETAERVRAAARALGYDPARQESARRLVMSRHGLESIHSLVATVFSSSRLGGNRYFIDMVRGILDALAPMRFGLLTIDPDASEPSGRTILPAICDRGGIDGLILFGDMHAERHLAAFRAIPALARRPVVSLVHPLPGSFGLGTDDADGFRQATSHLLDLGHRHVLALELAGLSRIALWSTPRWSGCEQALRERGLDPAKRLRRWCPPYPWFSPRGLDRDAGPLDPASWEGARDLLALLRAQPAITAIIAHNDPAALRVIHILRQAGLRVPEDISVIGCDDTDPLIDEHGRNRLTTVRLPLHQLGQRSAQLLLDRIMGEKPAPTPPPLPVTLMLRGTTAVMRPR